MMNKVKIVKEKFKFLIDKGFTFYKYKSNVEDCFVFSRDCISVVLTYDVRLHTLDIGILKNKGKYNNKNYMPLYETDIGTKSQREKLFSDIELIYFSAKNDWTISKKIFNHIVDLYAKFVNQNLIEIMGQSNQSGDGSLS